MPACPVHQRATACQHRGRAARAGEDGRSPGRRSRGALVRLRYPERVGARVHNPACNGPWRRAQPPLSQARIWVSSRKPPHVFCMLFPAWRMHYLNSPSAASPVQIPLSLLFLELSGNCVNAVRRHVTAVGILVRSGEDGTTSDNRRSGWRFSCPALRREPCPNRTICARRSGRSHLHVGLAKASVPCGWDLPGPLPATRPPVRMLVIGS